jgi:hypothetical protein
MMFSSGDINKTIIIIITLFLAEAAVGAVDDFWAALRELDRSRPWEVPGEHRCLRGCEPKPKVRRQTKPRRPRRWLS